MSLLSSLRNDEVMVVCVCVCVMKEVESECVREGIVRVRDRYVNLLLDTLGKVIIINTHTY